MALTSKKPTVVGGVSGGYFAWNPPPLETVEPTAPEKLAGWAPLAYPPSEYFNWYWHLVSLWTNWFAGQDEDAFVISSNTTEGDYTTIQLAIADGLASGDTLFIKTDQALLGDAGISIPAGIKIKVKKGVTFDVSGVWTGAVTPLTLGADCTIEGDLVFQSIATGTITKFIDLNGNGTKFNNIVINNTAALTITNGFYVEAAIAATCGEGETTASGGGVFTNVLIDNSGLLNNLISVREV